MINHEPNFFVIGAPKSGTTFLCQYLTRHPQVLFSTTKEPHFFNTDFTHGKLHPESTLNTYLEKNYQSEDKFSCVGEGSTTYLYSKTAVKNILQYRPDAKFVTLLRDPVQMCYSLHAEIFPEIETERVFEKAWKLQQKRRRGEEVPKNCKYPELLQYKEFCSIGSQTERVMGLVKPENLLILSFDDLVNKTDSVHQKLCKFLNIDYVKISLPPEKKASYPRSILLLKTVKLLAKHTKLKKITGLQNTNTLNLIHNYNTRSKNRPILSDIFLQELESEFRNEKLKIKKILSEQYK